MQQWYRSGIEAYCKTAAHMMGLPDNNSGWGNFGHDLFADGRFDDPAQASKTWGLSRFRSQGRSNRPKLFEDSWLGKHGSDCEIEAIHVCVHSMCNANSESALYDLYRDYPDTFAADFSNIVLPQMAEGFAAERYHSSDIARFSQGIVRALEKLDPRFPQTFRNFAIPLVAGVIYGPDHNMASRGTNSATIRKTSTAVEELPPVVVDESAIVLTQLFSDDAGLVGHSSAFDADCIILLGRGSGASNYLDACGDELAQVIAPKKPLIFPISHTHKSTSKAHGIIVSIDDNWYFCDFSTNGSYIENVRQPSAVHHGIVALAPGDKIYLGLSEPPAGDSGDFHLATTILVSFRVKETSFE